MRLYAEDTSTSMIHDANTHNSDYGEYTPVYSPRSDQLVLTQIKHTHTISTYKVYHYYQSVYQKLKFITEIVSDKLFCGKLCLIHNSILEFSNINVHS